MSDLEKLAIAFGGPAGAALAGMSMQKAEAGTCQWFQSDEDSEAYETSCKNMFTISSEPPHDWMKFCCYCGKSVVVNQWEPETGDE